MAVDAGQSTVEPDPDCQAPGCLRSAVHVGDYLKSYLEQFLEPGVVISNGYSIWVVNYAVAFDNEVRSSNATVAVPYPLEEPFVPLHIVANAHGTVGVADNCALAGTVYGSGLAGLFGSRGTISVAPDYVGLGTAGIHPYLNKEAEGASTLDGLRAAAQLAQYIGVPTSGRFGVVGLSQGGHASLAAAEMHLDYAPELDIRAFAAAGPASGWLEHWAAGVQFAGAHIALHGLLIYAMSVVEGHTDGELWQGELSAELPSIFESHCYFDFGGLVETFDSAIPEQPTALFAPGFLAAYSSEDLSAFPAIAMGFDKSRIEPFVQSAPIAIWQGDDDDIVPASYTEELVDSLELGGLNVEYFVVPGGAHTDVAFGFVAQHQSHTTQSIAWVRSRLDGP